MKPLSTTNLEAAVRCAPRMYQDAALRELRALKAEVRRSQHKRRRSWRRPPALYPKPEGAE